MSYLVSGKWGYLINNINSAGNNNSFTRVTHSFFWRWNFYREKLSVKVEKPLFWFIAVGTLSTEGTRTDVCLSCIAAAAYSAFADVTLKKSPFCGSSFSPALQPLPTAGLPELFKPLSGTSIHSRAYIGNNRLRDCKSSRSLWSVFPLETWTFGFPPSPVNCCWTSLPPIKTRGEGKKELQGE